MYLSHIRKDQREKLSRKVKSKYPKAIGGLDMLPQMEDYETRYKLYEAATYVCRQTGSIRVTTPVFENINLYKKVLSSDNSLFDKMVLYKETKENTYVLKPEMTISIARAHIENGCHLDENPREYWYYERLIRKDLEAKKSGYREYYQFGIESYREKDTIVDADLIYNAIHYLNLLGLGDTLQVAINNKADEETRKKWIKDVKLYFKDKVKRLPAEIKKILDKDPLKVLEVDDEDIKLHLLNAPQLTEYMSSAEKKSYDQLKELLDAIGIKYVEDITLMGEDYYAGNVFEFRVIDPKGKVVDTYGRGGRYNGLVESIGGEAVESAGFYLELDKLEAQLLSMNMELYTDLGTEIFIAHLGPNARIKAFQLVKEFRDMGIGAKENLGSGSLRNQLKEAEKMGVRYIILIGEKELEDGEIVIRDVELGDQQKVPIEQIHKVIHNHLGDRGISTFVLGPREEV